MGADLRWPTDSRCYDAAARVRSRRAGDSPDAPESEERPLILPVEDSLDLHVFTPRDIPDVVRDYLVECVRCGLSEVRLIHGRGTGTQRAIVRSILKDHPLVQAFADAPPERGGWGATVVWLKATTAAE